MKVLLTIFFWVVSLQAQADSSSQCDKLAGNPKDKYLKSKGVPFKNINASKAIKACESEHLRDPNNSRIAYQLGRSYEKAKIGKKAFRLYSESCVDDYPAACNSLGITYYYGEFVKKNDVLALHYYKKACQDKINSSGCFNAAGMYEYGKGTKLDLKMAKSYYQQACKKGDRNGCIKVDRILKNR